MKKLYHRLILAVATAGLVPLARALPELQIFDGTTTITVVDNLAGDASSAAGRIVWVGTIGNWTLNTDVGTTFPAIGNLTNPQLDLSFNAVSNGSGGTLSIMFSADGFGPSAGTAVASIGGTTSGTVVYDTFGGASNTLFDLSPLLAAQGPFTGAFSGAVSGGSVNNVGPYALTQQIVITHSGSGITTGDGLLTVPDSGTSLLLLGAGLTGLGFLARFRTRFV